MTDDHDRGIRLEERLAHVADQWAAHDRVHELDAQALRLQHREYQRRLEVLNNEAGRIAARDSVYVSREVYEAAHLALTNRLETAQDGLEAKVQFLEAWKNKTTGAAVILTLVSGTVGAVLMKALNG